MADMDRYGRLKMLRKNEKLHLGRRPDGPEEGPRIKD
jgi:hypothetical protein